MQAQFDRYLQYLASERRLSPHTVSAYQRDLVLLAQHAQQNALSDWAQWREFHVRQLVAALHHKGLSGRSLQRLLSAWRQFFAWLGRQHLVDSNPVAAVRAPKSAKKLPKALDVDQMNRLLAIDDDNWIARRDHAMFELFYSSGLRLSELAGLDLNAIDLAEGLVRVTGKGGKVRVLPVGRMAIKTLQQWLRVRGEKIAEGATEYALFINQKGLRLGVRAIQLRLKHYSVKQGLDEPAHPHMLRHAFASHMLESSGDLRAVQELLGHASISTTQIYTHLDFQHLANVYDAAHPRAHKRAPKAGDE
ncbi:MAG: tyrosine recombinase XerC [Pseudomonadales bacterium]